MLFVKKKNKCGRESDKKWCNELGRTYVMRHAVIVWKNSATEQRALERKLPMRLQRAKTPRKSEQTAKKRAMRTKGNIKRVK